MESVAPGIVSNTQYYVSASAVIASCLMYLIFNIFGVRKAKKEFRAMYQMQHDEELLDKANTKRNVKELQNSVESLEQNNSIVTESLNRMSNQMTGLSTKFDMFLKIRET